MLLLRSAACIFLASIIASVAGCPDGFSLWYEGYCLRLYSSNDTFDRNEAACKADGGQIVSIHSDLENRRIASTAAPAISWIGLQCNDSNGEYSWTDGTPVQILRTPMELADEDKKSGILLPKDNLSKPSAKCDPDSCYVLSPNGRWTPKNCTDRFPAICKHRQRNSVNCGNYEEIDGSNRCVRLRTDTATWTEAENKCVQDGARLVSIQDKKTNDDIVAKALAAGISGGLHIGLRSNSSSNDTSNRPRWSDGTDLLFTNFARGFPTDIFGRCGAMETASGPLSGQWLSNRCDSSRLPYVCGRKAYDGSRPVLPSGCPDIPYYLNETTISSPSYPGVPGSTACVYFFVAPEGRRARVDIEDLELNRCCDKIEIFDGAFGGKLIASLSGKVSNGTRYETSSENIMRLVYSATDGVRVRGWKLRLTIA